MPVGLSREPEAKKYASYMSRGTKSNPLMVVCVTIKFNLIENEKSKVLEKARGKQVKRMADSWWSSTKKTGTYHVMMWLGAPFSHNL